jgi:small subunit ribosomal protein S4
LARYIGPVCRQCRREGMKLFLKGERCHSEKCAIEKRNFIPGQHGKDRKKIVGYGLQLREKQKVRRVLRRAGRRSSATLFEKAAQAKGHHRRKPDERWSAAWTASSTAWASAPAAPRPARSCATATSGQRPQVRHSVVPGEGGRRGGGARKSKNNPTILAARDATAHAPAPNWIDVDRESLKGRIQSLPKREDLVQIQLNEQLIVELYSK